jgi:potassium efflux system protein
MEISNILLQVNEILKYPLLKIQNSDVSIWSVLVFFIIIMVSKRLAKNISGSLLEHYFKKSSLDIGQQDAVSKILSYSIYTIGLIIALETIGINLSALLAGGAFLAVGIGFGVQNIVTNFIAGLLLLFEQPIKKKDLIEVDTVLGFVEEISIRSTRIKTLDNVSIIVPNSKFITEKIINWTHKDSDTRIKLKVGVSYKSDPRLVEKLLIEIADKNEKVLKEPAPIVSFEDFGESALIFELLVWINEPHLKKAIKSQLNFEIFEIFKNNNIEIPYPQTEVHIKNS